MKKLTATILVILSIIFVFQPTMSAQMATGQMNTIDDYTVSFVGLYSLTVCPNDNKSGQLRLDWYSLSGTDYDGYQIFRSESGKKESYQLIKTTKQLFYIDKNLKNNKQYFYAVRAFIKNGKAKEYTDFLKESCWTKLTQTYATKLLQKAYHVAGTWMDVAVPNADSEKYIEKKYKQTDAYGKSTTYTKLYYQVKDKTINTKAELKKYLSKYFTNEIVKSALKRYIEENGKLYVEYWDWGGASCPIAEDNKVIYVSQFINSASFVVPEKWNELTTISYYPTVYNVVFESGRWLFSDKVWKEASHWIDL